MVDSQNETHANLPGNGAERMGPNGLSGLAFQTNASGNQQIITA